MKLYSLIIPIHATAYVRASSARQAAGLIKYNLSEESLSLNWDEKLVMEEGSQMLIPKVPMLGTRVDIGHWDEFGDQYNIEEAEEIPNPLFED